MVILFFLHHTPLARQADEAAFPSSTWALHINTGSRWMQMIGPVSEGKSTVFFLLNLTRLEPLAICNRATWNTISCQDLCV